MKLRLQPIRMFVCHHVCAEFDSETMEACDWMSIVSFKAKVMNIQKNGAKFISLQDAYMHIERDFVRCGKYAVITFDDGYASLKEILPWLEEQQIPVTLFVNGKYLDGESYRLNPKERYLTRDELWYLTSSSIEVGHHGWEHVRVTEQTDEEFVKSVERNVRVLANHPNYIPFWAYTYGAHTKQTDAYLQGKQIVPVYIDGNKNYDDAKVIHRELLQ